MKKAIFVCVLTTLWISSPLMAEDNTGLFSQGQQGQALQALQATAGQTIGSVNVPSVSAPTPAGNYSVDKSSSSYDVGKSSGTKKSN